VAGHSFEATVGTIDTVPVVVYPGRVHLYQGYSALEVTSLVRHARRLGCRTILFACATGAVPQAAPKGLGVITDHINNMGTNPLRGVNDDSFGTRFPDMTEVYNKDLIKLVDAAAKKLDISVKHGVYIASSGPSYETPAEIKVARTMGADAAGMSTVPEAIVANWCGMKVIGISCISNYASGVSDKKLSHQEVIETTSKVKTKFKELVVLLVKNIYL
jgi:purine-nucleoside phosphorylase